MCDLQFILHYALFPTNDDLEDEHQCKDRKHEHNVEIDTDKELRT